MSILFKSNDYGKIEYRIPRASEVFALIRLSEIPVFDQEKLKSIGQSEQMRLIENLIENMDKFIVSVDIKIEDDVITSYEKAKERFELAPILAEIAGDLMSYVNTTGKKKTT